MRTLSVAFAMLCRWIFDQRTALAVRTRKPKQAVFCAGDWQAVAVIAIRKGGNAASSQFASWPLFPGMPRMSLYRQYCMQNTHLW